MACPRAPHSLHIREYPREGVPDERADGDVTTQGTIVTSRLRDWDEGPGGDYLPVDKGSGNVVLSPSEKARTNTSLRLQPFGESCSPEGIAVADGSFFSGIVEGSGFAIGEAIGVVVLVAAGVGMSRDSFLEYLGGKIHGFWRRGRPSTDSQKFDWDIPWWRIGIWVLVTGLSGFLAWKAFLMPQVVITGSTQQQVDEKIAATTASIQKQLDQVTAQRDAANTRIRQLEAQQKAPPAPPVAVDGPRVFTDKTKEQLWNTYCEGRTELQCSILMNEEKNKWITFGAVVAIIHAGGGVEFNSGVICSFDSQWLPALSTLRPNDHVTITGQIVGFNVRFFILQKCEIKSPA
jgi:hypothetical protein